MKSAMIAIIAASVALMACTPAETTATTEQKTAETAPVDVSSARAAIDVAVANPARSSENVARDMYRHPAETLDFFGLKPGDTVIEMNPGGGAYYAEILAKFAKDTGGVYIGTGTKPDKLADASIYGEPTFVSFDDKSGPLVEAGTADIVVTFRNTHNWYWRPGMLDKAMVDFASALKPGGTLGVTEHRADPRAETESNGRLASDGYVSQATIVVAAEKAGLVLEATSEINANSKDTKDHPFGVWTLPPNLRSSNFGEDANAEFDSAPFVEIGESDRHTLRFRKPA